MVDGLAPNLTCRTRGALLSGDNDLFEREVTDAQLYAHVDVFGDLDLCRGGDIAHVAYHQLVDAVGHVGDRGLAVHVGHGIGAEGL